MLLRLLQKIVNKSPEATIKLIWNEIHGKIGKSKLVPERKEGHIEEVNIPKEKRKEIINNLRL